MLLSLSICVWFLLGAVVRFGILHKAHESGCNGHSEKSGYFLFIFERNKPVDEEKWLRDDVGTNGNDYNGHKGVIESASQLLIPQVENAVG